MSEQGRDTGVPRPAGAVADAITADTGLMRGPQPVPPESQVTLANWQDPPFNRWAFQHVRELIPTARIWRGDGPVSRLPREERDLSGIRFAALGREWSVDDLLRQTYTDGFLVLHRGRIVTERYFNGLTPHTPHLLMSVSKSIVSTVAGVLAGQGRLDVSSPVQKIVPELGGTSFADATVQHLLDMRTGTAFDESYDDPDSHVRLFEQVYLWRPRTARGLPESAQQYFATLENQEPHGGPFRYRSVLTDVLAWVIERAVGDRFHQVASRELWQALGAECDAEVTLDAYGNPMADGGICATLRDVARFGQLFVTRGRRDGAPIVSSEWIDDTVQGAPDGPRAFVEADDAPGYPAGAHYRNFWWVRDPATPFFHATGINGQNVFVHPPSETVVVKLSTWPTALSADMLDPTVACARAIAEALQRGDLPLAGDPEEAGDAS